MLYTLLLIGLLLIGVSIIACIHENLLVGWTTLVAGALLTFGSFFAFAVQEADLRDEVVKELMLHENLGFFDLDDLLSKETVRDSAGNVVVITDKDPLVIEVYQP